MLSQGCPYRKRRKSEVFYYLTLEHKLLPSFDAQQDALLVFNLRLVHRHYLLHSQQVLLQKKGGEHTVNNQPSRQVQHSRKWRDEQQRMRPIWSCVNLWFIVFFFSFT